MILEECIGWMLGFRWISTARTKGYSDEFLAKVLVGRKKFDCETF